MRKIKVWMDGVGGGDPLHEVLEIPDGATDEEIDEIARECVFNEISWGWIDANEEGDDGEIDKTWG